jgi:hypothetical protein
MLLSREEAEEVWCPFGRQLISARNVDAGTITAMTAVNRGSERSTGTNCVANACMAWRWAGWMLGPNGTPPIGPRPLPEDQKGPRLGYCGLAGTPYGAP